MQCENPLVEFERFQFLLYLADTPLWEKDVIEEVLREEREELCFNHLLNQSMKWERKS